MSTQPPLPSSELPPALDRKTFAIDEPLDANVQRLIDSFRARAEHGKRKYGVTTERTDLTFRQWLQHCLEEQMDACVYLTRIIKDLDDAEAAKAIPR